MNTFKNPTIETLVQEMNERAERNENVIVDFMSYTKKNGETNDYFTLEVTEIHPTHFIAVKNDGDIRRFNYSNVNEIEFVADECLI